MNDLNQLVEIDAALARGSELIFKELPESSSCANAGLVVFDAAVSRMKEYENDNPAQERFDAAAAELEISGPELLASIRQPVDELEHPAISAARGIDHDMSLIIAQRTLLQLCYRSYRWGLTDLRRLRLTASAGFLRMQTRVVPMLTRALPALATDATFKEAFETFRALEDKTWWVLERKYTDELRDFET